MPHPILLAKLEFLATAITGITAQYASDQLDEDGALGAVQEVLETFIAPASANAPESEPTAAAG